MMMDLHRCLFFSICELLWLLEKDNWRVSSWFIGGFESKVVILNWLRSKSGDRSLNAASTTLEINFCFWQGQKSEINYNIISAYFELWSHWLCTPNLCLCVRTQIACTVLSDYSVSTSQVSFLVGKISSLHYLLISFTLFSPSLHRRPFASVGNSVIIYHNRFDTNIFLFVMFYLVFQCFFHDIICVIMSRSFRPQFVRIVF